MKVLFLSPFVWDSSYRGRYYHFFRRFVSSGHLVTVLEPRLSENPVHPPEPGLRFIRPGRSTDVWGGAAEAVAALRPDVIIVTSPPGPLAGLASLAGWTRRRSPANSSSARPFLVFDYSDDHYLANLETKLGPAGFLAPALGRNALAFLARRADLVTASSENLRRQLPAGAVLVANPAGPKWGRAPVWGWPPAAAVFARGGRPVQARRLSVAVLGPFDRPTVETLFDLARERPDLAFSLLGALPGPGATPEPGPVPVPAARSETGGLGECPPNVRLFPKVDETRLTSCLTQSDVAVLTSTPSARAATARPFCQAADQPAERAVDRPADRFLAALSAGCPVLAAVPLKPDLAPLARAAELTSSELVYFSSLADLKEKLLRFSLIADLARSRRLEAKAELLRWAPAADEFQKLLYHLLGTRRSGTADD